MKKRRFIDSQIMEAFKHAEAGLAVPEICRKLRIGSATFYKWRDKFRGMEVSMMTYKKDLEDESRRLRKTVVDELLKVEIITEA
jgi:putative transposase